MPRKQNQVNTTLIAVLQFELAHVPFDRMLASQPEPVPISDATLNDSSRHIATYWLTNEAAPPLGRLSLYRTETADPQASRSDPAPYATRLVIPLIRGCLDHIAYSGAQALAADSDLDEPARPDVSEPQRLAAGVVLVDDRGRVTLVEPEAQYGGYTDTFPKGQVKPSDSNCRAAAERHLFEKTGLSCQIVAFIGDFSGDTTVTRFYLAIRTGGQPAASGTTAAVKQAGTEEALVS